AKGLMERIGMSGSSFKLVSKSAEEKITEDIKDHREAVEFLLKQLISLNVIKDYKEIDAIGHRDAHGGEYVKDSAIMDEGIIEKIVEMSESATLHNPDDTEEINAVQ